MAPYRTLRISFTHNGQDRILTVSSDSSFSSASEAFALEQLIESLSPAVDDQLPYPATDVEQLRIVAARLGVTHVAWEAH